MTKTKEELIKLKEEIEKLNKKLAELTDDELKQVTGGKHCAVYVGAGFGVHAPMFGESPNKDKIKPSSTHSWFGTKGSE